MNHNDFPFVRDTVALESMLARGRELEPLRADLWREYQGLRDMLAEARRRGDRKMTEGLEYELYNAPSGEYGDQGGIAWQWARVDAEIGDIERDARYIEYIERVRRTA